MVRRGDLIRVHPSTFVSATAVPTWEAKISAAVASLGHAAAAMRSSARLHGFDGCSGEFLEVVRCGRPLGRSGVLVHQTDWLPRTQVTHVRGIVTTNPPRTLIDLGAVLSPHALEIAVESAIRKGLVSHKYLQQKLDSYRGRGRRGCQALQHVLDLREGLKPTESIFETRLFQVLRDGGLPLPERQIAIYEDNTFVARPDFLYVKARVAIEAASRKHHLGPTNEARDSDRRRRLIAAGYTVVEVKWRDMVERPGEVVARVAEALGMRLL